MKRNWGLRVVYKVAFIGMFIYLTGCGLFRPKYGCKTNGRNIGAEKLSSGDPDAVRAARKAKKFRS